MRVVIVGATSGIAQEVARLYAGERAELVLIARDAAKLAAVSDDLRVRGASSVEAIVADLALTADHPALVSRSGVSDVVLIAHGSLPDQAALDADPEGQVRAFQLNATSVISVASHFALVLEKQRAGTLAVIGSVAGDRGRRSNYVYGAAKAAIHAYCQGLRARLAPAGVAVVLIKPGWVDTPMTAGFRKNPLFVSAATAGRAIHAAIAARKGTVYVPWFWGLISLVVRMMPARLVKF